MLLVQLCLLGLLPLLVDGGVVSGQLLPHHDVDPLLGAAGVVGVSACLCPIPPSLLTFPPQYYKGYKLVLMH